MQAVPVSLDVFGSGEVIFYTDLVQGVVVGELGAQGAARDLKLVPS